MSEPTDNHYKLVLRAFSYGELTPFLGAGVNLSHRPPGVAWTRRQTEYLPSGGELAEHLAEDFFYPGDDRRNLLRISQYAAIASGSAPLYRSLHRVFDGDFPPTAVHRLWAKLPALLQNADEAPDYPLIVTTNYDDLMERALQEAGQPYDVVAYVADGEQLGKFVHWPPAVGAPTASGLPAGKPTVIERPNEYRDFALAERPVVLKIHGAIDRALDGEWDSYVITEDHYIEYLTRTDVSSLIPVTLLNKLKRSSILFLGYSLSDWNLRAILHRIWGGQKLSWKSWAVQLDPDPIESEFWRNRAVDIVDAPLDAYVSRLEQAVQALLPKGGQP